MPTIMSQQQSRKAPYRLLGGSLVVLMVLCLVVASMAVLGVQLHVYYAGGNDDNDNDGDGGTAWNAISIMVDSEATQTIRQRANDHHYTACAAASLRARYEEYAPASEVLSELNKKEFFEGKVVGNTFVEILVEDAPCWGMDNCCETSVYFRRDELKDVAAFQRAFQFHELRFLYALFEEEAPKYVLDAGAGTGFSTQILKLVFPYSVHVALEANATNFENLIMNMREIDGVHSVHGALWPWQALLYWREDGVIEEGIPSHFLDDAVKYFRIRDPVQILKKGGLLGYQMSDLKGMFDIPSFDLVFLDIEGKFYGSIFHGKTYPMNAFVFYILTSRLISTKLIVNPEQLTAFVENEKVQIACLHILHQRFFWGGFVLACHANTQLGITVIWHSLDHVPK